MIGPTNHHRETKILLLATTSLVLIDHFYNIDTIPNLALNINPIETSDQNHSGLHYKCRNTLCDNISRSVSVFIAIP